MRTSPAAAFITREAPAPLLDTCVLAALAQRNPSPVVLHRRRSQAAAVTISGQPDVLCLERRCSVHTVIDKDRNTLVGRE